MTFCVVDDDTCSNFMLAAIVVKGEGNDLIPPRYFIEFNMFYNATKIGCISMDYEQRFTEEAPLNLYLYVTVIL